MTPLLTKIYSLPNPVGIKAVLSELGLCKAFVRAPLIEPSLEDMASFKNLRDMIEDEL